MADNIDIRLDQLTEAVKGLYAKSSTSQGEIYNALTSLSQRYENLQNISSEKIATTLINEFRKTIDLKYGQTNQYIRDLENALKSFIATSSAQNPKMSAEITKIVQDLSNTYSKLTSQDLALQKIFNLVESQNNTGSGLEITKLSDNFVIFSKNFENIIITLNKNFADFLEQVKQNSSKEEIKSVQVELDNIAGNVNSIISAIAVIDTKYKDLTGLIGLIQSKENVFDEALREVKGLGDLIKKINDKVLSFDVKKDVEALNQQYNNKIDLYSQDVGSKIENIKQEIQKIIEASNTTEVKSAIQTLATNITSATSNIQNLSSNITNTKDEIKNLSTTVQSLTGEVKDIRTLINEEVLYKSKQFEAEYQKYLNASKEDIKILLTGLEQFKNDVNEINQGNIKILQEPIIKAMNEFNEQDLGKNIKEMSSTLRDISLEVQSSIQNMQSNLANINTSPSLEILNQMSEAIPAVADKLEIFRNHVVSENSMHLNEIKTSFSEAIKDFRESLNNATIKLEEETRNINSESSDALKLDLQKLSDYLVDSVEAINEKIKKEFEVYKKDFQETYGKQEENQEKTSDKVSSLEVAIENLSTQTLEKLSDGLESTNAKTQDTLNDFRSDVLENIISADSKTQDALSEIKNDIKADILDINKSISKLNEDFFETNQESSDNIKTIKDCVIELEAKIERTNLQQIHNAKELLEEIQTNALNIETKVNALSENDNKASVFETIKKIEEKLQSIAKSNDVLYEEFQLAKEDIEQKLKENSQRVQEIQNQDSSFSDAQSNLTQEIKSDLAQEIQKLEASIKKIKSPDENSSYTYSLEDVESDFAKLRVAMEKNLQASAEIKPLFEKIIELRTVGVENIKINREIENEIGNLSGWLKDTNSKIDELSQNVEDVQNNALQEIRSQLIQSEKSKHSASEFYTKIENILKHLVKTSQNADVKIQDTQKKIGLILQAQSESFNPSQFIDIFYENMTQTKMLSNRVEIMEDKINSIQSSLDKLISYVEQ